MTHVEAPPTGRLQTVAQWIYREARLADEHRFADWEALWTDDGVYWIPANGDTDQDPEQVMSIVYDNRSRIGLRIRQFGTGKRFSAEPRSRLRRLVSNLEILEDTGTELRVGANCLVFESNTRGDQLWAARVEYLLRPVADDFRMARKTVILVNNDRALWTMSFLR